MVMYAKIRRMFFREHLSISEIARRTTLTRNTIKKWLKAADGSEPKYRRVPVVCQSASKTFHQSASKTFHQSASNSFHFLA